MHEDVYRRYTRGQRDALVHARRTERGGPYGLSDTTHPGVAAHLVTLGLAKRGRHGRIILTGPGETARRAVELARIVGHPGRHVGDIPTTPALARVVAAELRQLLATVPLTGPAATAIRRRLSDVRDYVTPTCDTCGEAVTVHATGCVAARTLVAS